MFDTLNDEGLILNKAHYEDMLGKHLESDIMISPKGISFLHENSTIDKVKKSVKGIAVIISDIPGL
ncbi:YjcQ family protein [Ligilactobacillus salivarius]|uniref:YjcQ family protein n=1 Tax=Ligilactobacillus salivarius TaxID=1624 RepID=UPI001CDACD06|nr:YjcQ family protein [Ligilactobacillus salivarius]